MGHTKVKVVDEFRVAPPPGSLPATLSLPLTLFDLRSLISTHKFTMRLLFFFAYPRSLHHFTQTTIPSLKHSLSLTLQYFYPYVSNLVLPPAPQKPYFLFTEGNSISFTVAQYSGDNHDFDDFISDQTKPVGVLYPFAPRLPPMRVSPDGTRLDSLLAVQVTLFPNQGVCIGIGYKHVVADGTAFDHFIKSWASICRSNGIVDKLLIMPSFNRDTIKDPYKTESKLLQKLKDIDWSSQGRETENVFVRSTYAEKVRSIFVMKQTQIEKLKRYFSNNSTNQTVHLTSFLVTCSFIWACLITSVGNNGDDSICHFRFPVNCRNRYGIRLPTTYFGNCIVRSFAVAKRSELVEHNGFTVAARAIANCRKALESSGAMRAIEDSVTGNVEQLLASELLVTVSGSPKFSFHKIDFGWGFPKKIDFLHPDDSQRDIFLSGCREEEDGIEFTLELEKAEMDAFTRFYYKGLRDSLL